ncbi:MAG: nucleoside 2-deoxyribosyltransferase [Mailhella sp.]|nr:nucleoside 2-deoxyribosyltransferase [Mailhella sp.]
MLRAHRFVWHGELISQADVAAWGADAPKRIMQIDSEAILACDAVVALLVDAQVDDGTAWEIGSPPALSSHQSFGGYKIILHHCHCCIHKAGISAAAHASGPELLLKVMLT